VYKHSGTPLPSPPLRLLRLTPFDHRSIFADADGWRDGPGFNRPPRRDALPNGRAPGRSGRGYTAYSGQYIGEGVAIPARVARG
jgi:hypothetical protein